MGLIGKGTKDAIRSRADGMLYTTAKKAIKIPVQNRKQKYPKRDEASESCKLPRKAKRSEHVIVAY